MAAGLAFGLANPAVAQQPAAGELEEIVVTAQKKAQSIQEVPMSISAFSEADIELNDFSSIADYGTRVPNLAFAATGESRSAAQLAIAIRGVVGKGTTGFYIDEAPLLASINPLVMDLERIEVLRGPQGTLYGARSMGGTVRLITKEPGLSKSEGRLRGQLSSTVDGGVNYRMDGAVNLPLVPDRFAVRVIAYGEKESGFIDRAASTWAPVHFGVHRDVNGNDTYGGQVSGLLSVADGDFTLLPKFSFENRRWDGRSWADTKPDNRVNQRLFDLNEKGDSDWKLATLTARYKRPYGEFVSATSYFKRASNDTDDSSEMLNLIFFGYGLPGYAGDPPPLPFSLKASDDDRLFSQEVRFSSSFDGPVQFTAGGFYQDSRTKTVFPPSPFFVFPSIFDMRLTESVREVAAFGELTFDLTRRLSLTAGARYFDNQVDFASVQGGLFGNPTPFSGGQSESGVTPKFSLQYRLDEQRNLYVTAAQGFRIGGVNTVPASACAADLAALGLTDADVSTYKSDTLWSYEAGLHSSWLDRRLTFNVAAFLIDWKDMQQRVGLGTCGFFANLNAGAARNKGGEFDLRWAATDGLLVSLGAGYTDSEITDAGKFVATIVKGDPVQNAPRWTASAALDYDFRIASLPLFVHADFAYVDKSYNANNTAPLLRLRPAYNLTNVRGGAHLGRWDVSLFVENLTDEKANLADVSPMAIEFPGRQRISVNRPRTFGAEAKMSF